MVKKNNGQHYDEFYEMFLDQLRDIYNAETAIVKNMPKMVEAAKSKELKDAFKKHLTETKGQKDRLEKVFSLLGADPEGEECEAIKGLLEESEEVIKHRYPPFVEDAALIGAAQKIEHYEIATYGTLRTFAHHLGLEEVESNLQEILDEEGKTNKALTKLAEGNWITSGINAQAVSR